MRIVSAHQLGIPPVLRLPGPTGPQLALMFLWRVAAAELTPGTWLVAPLASLGVGDGYQCWVVGVRGGHEAICWVFCVALPFVSIYGVVLPILAVMIPSFAQEN